MHLYGHQLELPSPQKNYLTQVPTVSWDGSRLMKGWLKTIKADFLCLNLRQLCHPSSKALHTIRSSLRHYRSVFLVAHSCEFIFFFFFTVVPAKRLYNKPPVLRFRVCTKWTWSKMCGILQKNAGWITLND